MRILPSDARTAPAPRASRPPPAPRASRTPPALLALAGLLAAAVTALIYYRMFCAFPKMSDEANALLSGADMIRGNWRLAGWWMPPDSFWTLDAAVYAALTGVFGIDPRVLAMAPALLWTMLLAVSLWLAGRGLGRRRAAVGATVVLALTGLPLLLGNQMMYLVSFSAIHVESVAVALLCCGLLDLWLATRRARWLALLGLALGLGAIGDPLVAIEGALPCLAGALWSEAGAWPGRRQLLAVAAILAAVLAAHGVLRLNAATGGFSVAALPMRFASFAALGPNVGYVLQSLLTMFGIDVTGHAVAAAWPELARLPLAALAVAGAWRVVAGMLGAWRGGRAAPARLDVMLCCGLLIDVLACLVSDQMQGGGGSARYLLPALGFGAVLAARMFSRVPAVALLGLAGIVAGIAVDLPAYSAGRHAPLLVPPAIASLARALEQRGLARGYGPYWSASIVTVASRGEVAVRPLAWENGRLGPHRWIASAGWYRDFGRRPFFVVLPAPGDFFTTAEVIARFGAPGETFQVAGYTVGVWR